MNECAMLKKILLVALSAGLALHTYAATTREQRLIAVERLFERYPCEKFNFEADKTGCEWDRKILALDDSLNLEQKKWDKLLKDKEQKLNEWATEDARIRNNIAPKLGMSKSYIYKHVLGAPDSINESLDSRGQTAQWVYRTEEGTMYLYFDNKGILRSMQRNR